MSKEIKFRGNNMLEKWVYGSYLYDRIHDRHFILTHDESGNIRESCVNPKTVGQYTGLKDKNGKKWFINDIGEFENGDRFVLKMEDWLEVSVSWIGDPECEDQVRDLYRIENAKNIGNIYENPELLKKN